MTGNALYEEWLTNETEDDDAVIYVQRTLPDGTPFAHVLFEADWGDEELAEHIAKLHNLWLARRRTEEAT